MGPWGIAAIVAVAAFCTETGRTYLKKALKTGIRAGYEAKDAAGELVSKAKDYTEEIAAESKKNTTTEKTPTARKKTKAASHDEA